MFVVAIVLILFGLLFIAICAGAIVLIDPIIAILCIIGIFKFAGWIIDKFDKK